MKKKNIYFHWGKRTIMRFSLLKLPAEASFLRSQLCRILGFGNEKGGLWSQRNCEGLRSGQRENHKTGGLNHNLYYLNYILRFLRNNSIELFTIFLFKKRNIRNTSDKSGNFRVSFPTKLVNHTHWYQFLIHFLISRSHFCRSKRCFLLGFCQQSVLFPLQIIIPPVANRIICGNEKRTNDIIKISGWSMWKMLSSLENFFPPIINQITSFCQ